MKLIKLIITIPKDKYCYIQELEQGNTDYATTRMLYHAVKHGKPYLEQEPKTDVPDTNVGKWIPVKTRPMTEEEIEYYLEYTDMRIDSTYTILDCPLPDDGQEVLVSWGGNVGIDVFVRDTEGCYFDGVDIDEVDAWMALPEPYNESEE